MASSSLNLAQLRVQAKELLKGIRAAQPEALQRARKLFPTETDIKLAQAQLIIARENGYSSWAKLKTDLDQRHETPVTRFFAAVSNGEVAVVQTMLQGTPEFAGAWRRTHYGGWESALHVAAEKGDLDMAKALVDAGAEVYAVRQSDYPPVFAACFSGNPQLVEFLMEASQARDNGQPPTFGCGIDIVLATRLDLLDRVKMHVEKDPFAVYRRGCIGETVLHWPAHNGYVEVVEFLLDHGASIEADEIGLYGGKPLHWASEHAPGTVRLLLDRGANPNARNLIKGEFEGFTPLHMCASQPEQSIEVARLLLAAGTDIHAKDALGRTALEVSRDNSRTAMTAFLEGQA